MSGLLHDETPQSNLELHYCKVEQVHDSGLITTKSTRGPTFRQVNILKGGVESTPAQGQWVVVLTDGAQHVCLGDINGSADKEGGGETFQNTDNDLFDLEGAKSIIAQDPFGNQARVVTSPGGGVLVDAGEFCTAHFDVGHDKLTEFFERSERIMPGHYAKIDHDGTDCTTHLQYRTKVDQAALERNLDHEAGADQNTEGHTVSVDIHPPDDGEVCQMELHNGKDSKLHIAIKEDGTFTLDGEGDVTVEAKEDVTVKAQKATVDANRVDVLSKNINLGSENPKDKEALNNKIKSWINSRLTTWLDTHTHLQFMPLIPLPPAPTGPTLVPTVPSTPSVGATPAQSNQQPPGLVPVDFGSSKVESD